MALQDSPMHDGWRRRKTLKVVYVSQAGLTSIKWIKTCNKARGIVFILITCSCTIFVIVSSVGCGLCNSTLGHLVTYHILLSALLASHYVGSPKLESTQLRQTGKEHSTSPWASWHKLKKTNFFVFKLKSFSADDVINEGRFMTWSSLNVLYVYVLHHIVRVHIKMFLDRETG